MCLWQQGEAVRHQQAVKLIVKYFSKLYRFKIFTPIALVIIIELSNIIELNNIIYVSSLEAY